MTTAIFCQTFIAADGALVLLAQANPGLSMSCDTLGNRVEIRRVAEGPGAGRLLSIRIQDPLAWPNADLLAEADSALDARLIAGDLGLRGASLSEAWLIASELLTKNPDALPLLDAAYNGVKRLRHHEFFEARKDFATAYAESAHPDLLLMIAECSRQLDDWAGAELALKTMVATQPENAVAWCALGNLYRSAGEFDRSNDCFSKALEIDPSWRRRSAAPGLGPRSERRSVGAA